MKLKKCASCKNYTLKHSCENCESQTKEAHYKHVRLKGKKDKGKVKLQKEM